MTARNFVDVYNFLHQLKVLAKTKKITEKVDEKENAEENLEEELKEETEEESEEETDGVEYNVDGDGPISQSWPTHDFFVKSTGVERKHYRVEINLRRNENI